MSKTISNPDEILSNRFCALKYCGSNQSEPQLHELWVIALFVDCTGHLRFFMEPNWRQRVEIGDVADLDELFLDLRHRVKKEGSAVFKQICELNHGPLLTYKVGDPLATDQEMLDTLGCFIEIVD